MQNKNWTPTQEENLGIITNIYKSIKENLTELQEVTNCPDSFIYNFIGRIQNEWDPKSCHSLSRKKKINN